VRYAEIWEVPKIITRFNKRHSGARLCILCLLLLGELAHGHVSFCEAESRSHYPTGEAGAAEWGHGFAAVTNKDILEG
jgi:hypothetical protein